MVVGDIFPICRIAHFTPCLINAISRGYGKELELEAFSTIMVTKLRRSAYVIN